MRQTLFLISAFLLALFPWAALCYLDDYSIKDRNKRDLAAWESSSLELIGQIQSGQSIEKQYERIANRLRDRMGDFLESRPGRPIDSVHFVQVCKSTFPNDLASSAVYLFERNPAGDGWKSMRGEGLAQIGSRLMEPVIRGLVNSAEGKPGKIEINNKCRALFGEFLSVETLGKMRVGRVSPGTFNRSEVWIYWNTLRCQGRQVGVFLLMLPRRTPFDWKEGLEWQLSHWERKDSYPFFLNRLTTASEPEIIAHKKLLGFPWFKRFKRRLCRHLLRMPLGKASRFPGLLCIRYPLSEDKPYDACIVSKAVSPGKTFVREFLFLYNGIVSATLMLVTGLYFKNRSLPRVSVRATFFILLLFIAGIPLFVSLLFGLQQFQGLLDRQMATIREDNLDYFKNLDVSGEHQKNKYKLAVDKEIPWWILNRGKGYKYCVNALFQRFQDSGLPLVACLAFDRNGSIFRRFDELVTQESGNAIIDYFQDWTSSGFLELEKGLDAIPEGTGFGSERTEMFRYVMRTLSPYRSAASLVIATLGIAEAVILEDSRMYNIHHAIVVGGRVEAFLFTLWRPDFQFERYLHLAIAERNSGSEDGFSCVVRNDREKLAPIVPSPTDRFWTTPAGNCVMEGFKSFTFKRTGFSETRNGFDLTIQQSYTAPAFLFGAVTPLETLKKRNQYEEWLLKGGLVTLGFLVSLVGWIVSRKLLYPIKKMEESLRAVARGDLGQSLSLSGNLEFTELSMIFNEMIEGLRERRNLDRFVSGSLAADVMAGISPGKSGLKQVGSVLVSDIRGFTTLSEKHPSDLVISLLNNHFDALAQEVQSQSGFVDKFIGDAVVAVFLDDGKTPSHQERALEAAFCIKERVSAIQAKRAVEGLFSYEFGIGIASGELVALTFGKALQRWEHQVFGFPVQRAEALEGLSKLTSRTRIVCEESVMQACPGFVFQAIQHSEAWELIARTNECPKNRDEKCQ